MAGCPVPGAFSAAPFNGAGSAIYAPYAVERRSRSEHWRCRCSCPRRAQASPAFAVLAGCRRAASAGKATLGEYSREPAMPSFPCGRRLKPEREPAALNSQSDAASPRPLRHKRGTESPTFASSASSLEGARLPWRLRREPSPGAVSTSVPALAAGELVKPYGCFKRCDAGSYA